ncbi:hypothetical protein B7486_60435 [cyanobacterium TDX16]|nr:hypothetical protein B7486_60435 [cyanobacterium TDX16]
MRPEGTGRVSIDVHVGDRPMPHHLPRRAFRWLEPSFMTPVEAQAYVFILQIVEGSVFLFGGRTGLLHSSCVERDGSALALTSTGGVGKTSTAARLLRRPGWRYLSDDIVFVTPDAEVRLHRRWPMVYAYNVAHDHELRESVSRRGGRSGHVQWRVHELAHLDRRRRRVPPATLYGPERVGDRGALEAVAFLTRGSDEQLVVEETSAADLSRRCCAVILDEQRTLVALLRHWEAAGTPFVSVDEVAARHERTFSEAFATAHRRVLARLPASGDVGRAADAFEDLMA